MNRASQTIRATATRLVVLLGWACLAGCSDGAAPVPADEDRARQTLERALTSWQQGTTVEALKGARPSIVASDPKWLRGAVLKKYEVQGKGKPSGAEREFNVTLWLADPRGKEAREQVVYRVGTSPIYTVFRALF